MASNEMHLSLKLLVDTNANKVLFAETRKEFVDFIFHIMSLPLGTVVKLLTEKNMVGCLGDLYESAKSLNSHYFNSNLNKDSILNPKTTVNVPLLSLNEAPKTTDAPKQFYRCSSGCRNYFTDDEGLVMKCPKCQSAYRNGIMNSPIQFVKPTTSSTNTTLSSSGSSGGYVKGMVTYMLMDNLEVKPMSTSGITLINKFNVKDVSCLEEKEVRVGFKEGLAILKASLETKAVLTSVFLIGTQI
ncbi:hypothetical protein BVRB_2g024500 [Beta vulgaris subsp. vulgaris]|nr:hypothetical protein BVRB_2g024500 [Beta vulgaris subsp. vulgaris]